MNELNMKLPLFAVMFGLTVGIHAQDLAPESISGITGNAIILTGNGFFAGSGAYQLTITSNAIGIGGITPNIPAQTFDYSYQKTGARTGVVSLRDRATGISATNTLSFETNARASYVLTSGIGNQTGKLILEYSPVVPVPISKLINISTSGQVSAGSPLTAGFVISGTQSKIVIIRAVGPSLAQFGVSGFLADPTLTLRGGNGQTLAANDNWGGGGSIDFSRVGAFGFSVSSRDAALQVSLPPGAYTAEVSGVANTSGIALVEVYEVP